MMIHIGRSGNRLGSFSEFEVRQGLASGRFFLSDLGWTEGMDTWAPLSTFPEFSPAPPMPPLPGEDTLPDAAPLEESGLPWDQRRSTNLLSAFAQTARLIFVSPADAFSRMLRTGPLSGPLLYNLIGSWFGLIASGLYTYFRVKMQGPPPPNLTDMEKLLYPTMDRAELALKWCIIMGPFVVTIGALLCSAIIHLLLMLTGGANRPFHVTLRVFCFAYGTTQLLQIIPLLGVYAAPAWLMVTCVIGLSVAHKTSTARVIITMLLFMVAGFACCLGTLAVALASLGALPQVALS